MVPQFFEGPEKKLELVVVDGHEPLRSLGDQAWGGVARAAGAEVISKLSNEHCDAYLLSESSLLVHDSFVTMITCGRTRLVDAVAEILTIVPNDAIALLFYERKNENFPEAQPTTFFDDARRLRDWLGGAALRFGAEHEHAVRIFHTTRPFEPESDDTTIEILMHGIDERCAASFRGDGRPGSGTLAAKLGLDRILDGFEIDEYLFEPVGYSLNALRGPHYFTLHVTPQRIGSYASFETNVDFRADPSALVARVIERFRPESFDVVSFAPEEERPAVELSGYRLRRRVHERVCGYLVSFHHLYRPGAASVRAATLDLG